MTYKTRLSRTWATTPNLVAVSQVVRAYVIRPVESLPPSKYAQGRWQWRRLIGNLLLPISDHGNYGPILYRIFS